MKGRLPAGAFPLAALPRLLFLLAPVPPGRYDR
jgi:hypothetical protein